MCTYIIYHDKHSATPLTVATTREDSPLRPTSKPFLWDKPELLQTYIDRGTLTLNYETQRYLDAGIIAPQDEQHGGTFMGTNKHGLFAAINNRENSLKFTNRRSRGGMVLDALTFTSAQDAAETLYPIVAQTQAQADRKYPGFNLIVADDKGAYVVTNARKGDVNLADSTVLHHQDVGEFTVALSKINERTVSMIGGHDINDLQKSARTRKFLPVFSEAATLPRPHDVASWGNWLSHMVHHTESGNPREYSIAQPDPKSPESPGKGNPDWVTIGTNMLTGTRSADGMDYEWLSMDAPPREGRMQAQQVTRSGNTPVELFLHGHELSARPVRCQSSRAV